MGEQIFRLEGDAPDFKGYEKELLELINVSEEDYQIDAAAWDGESSVTVTWILDGITSFASTASYKTSSFTAASWAGIALSSSRELIST